MKRIRHFREYTGASLPKPDAPSFGENRIGARDVSPGVEVSVLWMEMLRNELLGERNPAPFLESLQGIIHEPIVWLRKREGEADILLSDFDIPEHVREMLCALDGFYGKLANIRFSRYFEGDSEVLKNIVALGHPPVKSWYAVPIFVNGDVSGSLSVGTVEQAFFDQHHRMLMSLAAVVLSILGEDTTESR